MSIQQIDVINSSCDEKSLVKALVLIHKDLMTNGRTACHTLCEKKLVEALVGKLEFY